MFQNNAKDNSLCYRFNPILCKFLIKICLLFRWFKMPPDSCIKFMGSLIWEASSCVRSISIGAHNRLQWRWIYERLATKVQKANCYSNRSLCFGLFLSTFSRYQTILVMNRFREDSLSSLICATTITKN